MGATIGSGANDVLEIYRAPSAGGQWDRAASAPTLVQSGSLDPKDMSFAGLTVAWSLAAGTVREAVDGGRSWQLASPTALS